MSAISISLTPGKIFAAGEVITNDQLNLLGQPAIQLQGQLGTAQLENQSVTTAILADGAVTAAKVAALAFTADGTGTAPFAPLFLSTLMAAQNAQPADGRTGVVVTNNGTTPNTKADITAAQMALSDGAGGYYLAESITLTVDITASGSANGLDTLPGTGATSSTWYYIFLIANATSNTVQGLISTSATAPTLPSGFTYFGLVGMVYNNSSSQFVKFRAVNRRVYTAETVLFSAFAATTSWASYTTNVATAVPPNAKKMFGTMGGTGTYALGLAGDANGVGAQYAAGASSGSGVDSFVYAANFEIPLITSQTIYVKAAGTSSNNRAVCTGWEF